MRVMGPREKTKRGCDFCEDYVAISGCIHRECPYHELDDVKTYREYEKKIKGKSPLERYLKKLFLL